MAGDLVRDLELTPAQILDQLVDQCREALRHSPHREMTVRLTVIASLAEQARSRI